MALSYLFMKVLLPFHLLFVTSLMSPISCNKVSLGLYYESLCPYSASFIIDSLDMIFSDGLISIVDLKLVPWGNTKLYGTHNFKCQVMHITVFITKLLHLGHLVYVKQALSGK